MAIRTDGSADGAPRSPQGTRSPGRVTRGQRLRPGFLAGLPVLAGAALVLAGCEGLLEVQLPTQVGAEVLDDPALAEVLENSLISDFECAFTNYVPATANVAGEMRHATGLRVRFLWSQRRVTADEPDLESCTSSGFGVFRPLHTARFQAEELSRLLDEWGDRVSDRTRRQAVARTYAGYSLTLLGEGYCEMTVDAGPIIEPREVFEQAASRFDEAIAAAQAAGDEEILNTARVGKARVLLNLGRAPEAAELAEQVPEGFVRWATRSPADSYRRNKVWDVNINAVAISVDEDYVGLEVDGVPDPRVDVHLSPNTAADGGDIYWQTKYDSPGSPLRIASWEEAQLIIAEARLGQEAVARINALRESHGVPLYVPADPGNDGEILAQVLEERSRELFLEGHRLNDMLRHDLPFKTGIGPDGVPYGNTTCLPIPRVEREGNPNIDI